MPNECPICGAVALSELHGEFRFEPPDNIPGGVMVFPNASWQECQSCGEQILPPELDRAIDDESRRRQGLLTPREIREIRERTCLSQEDMARLLGIGDKTYARWEAGRSCQNKSSDYLIRLADRNPGLLSVLEARRRPDRSLLIAEYVEKLCFLKGEHRTAMAAHGAELDQRMAELLRQGLQQIARTQPAE